VVRLSSHADINQSNVNIYFNPKSGSIKFCDFLRIKKPLQDFNPKSGSIKLDLAGEIIDILESFQSQKWFD